MAKFDCCKPQKIKQYFIDNKEIFVKKFLLFLSVIILTSSIVAFILAIFMPSLTYTTRYGIDTWHHARASIILFCAVFILMYSFAVYSIVKQKKIFIAIFGLSMLIMLIITLSIGAATVGSTIYELAIIGLAFYNTHLLKLAKGKISPSSGDEIPM